MSHISKGGKTLAVHPRGSRSRLVPARPPAEDMLDVAVHQLLGAFAVTAILENVFASAMLKTRRPIRVGDQVWTNDRAGTVTGLQAEVGATVTNGAVICELKD